MNQDVFDWILLLVRWLHITVAVTWIGTSIFFMWLDRSFEKNPDSKRPGHVGEVWMVHGGGFYHVEKLLLGPTKVPERLHWFKWESYWTWMSGFTLTSLVFYTGDGTFLLDDMVSSITYWPAVGLALFSIFGSWFFYDRVWESKAVRGHAMLGHVLTIGWLIGMTYVLCHTLSGRAAYLHVGAMLGTWMTANVFMRIIPRQLEMVRASGAGEPVNQEWGINAKNRSTHNTYFTLPVIFTMLSNHFPNTYGHEYNWVILLLICLGGAAIREYFVVRIKNPVRSYQAAAVGIALITGVITFSGMETGGQPEVAGHTHQEVMKVVDDKPEKIKAVVASTEKIELKDSGKTYDLSGVVTFEGTPPVGKKLNLPSGCDNGGKEVFSNEVIVNNGKVQNVLIRVIRGHEGKKYADVPSQEVELDQRGCIYTPRVAAARVGQKVTFINSDPIFHNVRSVTKVNQKFNMAMPKKNQRETKVFTKPELFLQAKCSVHPWMGAYVAIMDHPFYAISNEKGEFTLPKLPVGNYRVEAWHEVFGTQTREITVSDNGLTELTFTFKK
ncbi:MAG: urate hydroxylase PuuD [Bacteriovoracia bacterium]